MGAPQVSYARSCQTPSKCTNVYAQVLPCTAGLAEKMLLYNFQWHSVGRNGTLLHNDCFLVARRLLVSCNV